MAKQQTLLQYTFASTSEHQNRSNRQVRIQVKQAVQPLLRNGSVQNEPAQQVTRQESQDTEDSNQSNAICQERLISCDMAGQLSCTVYGTRNLKKPQS